MPRTHWLHATTTTARLSDEKPIVVFEETVLGDANGNITITEVIVDDAEKTVELVFAAPLYDGRYTLWVSDSLSDPAGNALDGESGALAPFEGNDAPDDTPPIFPTGDGAHGGSFHARFTIDTRPEIGTYLGLKLETVSRCFSKFQDDNVLQVKQRQIEVLDPEALRKIVNGSTCL